MNQSTNTKPDNLTRLLLILVLMALIGAGYLVYRVATTVLANGSHSANVECLNDLKWEEATLRKVIDGDTIEVVIGGRVERVRYIGVNTPERGQPFYREATNANATLLEGKPIRLARDVSDRDRYNRLLRYVVADDRFVNLALVEQGMAQVATYPPDVRCVETFLAAQREALQNGVGLWERTDATRPGSGFTSRQSCHPSYPDACIPPPPPDLDCDDIPYRRFRVLQQYGDPHRFDGDSDGVGCER
ncbi:thermonuclease family protein [Chloroflexus sp.]|uniref:thermonuclease family protein n=1 Tax=Chloroflexus sp. TaxID=1904827 RepID=UPI00262DD128|nr:thermonuclease family protein [uncultured Chloroflexus sp.]